MKNSDIKLDLFRRIDTLSDDLLQELQLVVENLLLKKIPSSWYATLYTNIYK